MRKQRIDALNTRQSLLEAAGEIFGKKGFWSATHEEICSLANANTAAVNYHFGSKENLYVEAWKHSYKKSLEKYRISISKKYWLPIRIERFNMDDRRLEVTDIKDYVLNDHLQDKFFVP